jgi:predicted small secreted protein
MWCLRRGAWSLVAMVAVLAGCSDRWSQVTGLEGQGWRIRVATCNTAAGHGGDDLLKRLQDAAMLKCGGGYEMSTPRALARNDRGSLFGECAHGPGVESIVHCLARPRPHAAFHPPQ